MQKYRYDNDSQEHCQQEKTGKPSVCYDPGYQKYQGDYRGALEYRSNEFPPNMCGCVHRSIGKLMTMVTTGGRTGSAGRSRNWFR
jgi:hypothetical protein